MNTQNSCLNTISDQFFCFECLICKRTPTQGFYYLMFSEIIQLTSYILQKLIRTKNPTRRAFHVVQYSSRIVLNYYTAKNQGRVLLTSVVRSPENLYYIVWQKRIVRVRKCACERERAHARVCICVLCVCYVRAHPASQIAVCCVCCCSSQLWRYLLDESQTLFYIYNVLVRYNNNMFPCTIVYEYAVLVPFRQHVFRFRQKTERAYCWITRCPFSTKRPWLYNIISQEVNYVKCYYIHIRNFLLVMRLFIKYIKL